MYICVNKHVFCKLYESLGKMTKVDLVQPFGLPGDETRCGHKNNVLKAPRSASMAHLHRAHVNAPSSNQAHTVCLPVWSIFVFHTELKPEYSEQRILHNFVGPRGGSFGEVRLEVGFPEVKLHSHTIRAHSDMNCARAEPPCRGLCISAQHSG